MKFKTRLKISRDKWNSTNAIAELLYTELIEQEFIDSSFYNVGFRLLNRKDDVATDAYIFIIEYELSKREIWNDLSECEERLKIGL